MFAAKKLQKPLTNDGSGGIFNRELGVTNCDVNRKAMKQMNLTQAREGEEYIIRAMETNDEEMDAFLFSLGCYSGEPITVISQKKGGCIVSIKDGRYHMDRRLAAAIQI